MKSSVWLAGVSLLVITAACTASTPQATAVGASAALTASVQSATHSDNNATVAPPTTSTTEPVPWNPAEFRTVADLVPEVELPYQPGNLTQCDGNEFRLLPSSVQTTSTVGGLMTTTFVLQFTGSALCFLEEGFYRVDMTAADGTIVPIDAMPSGPVRPLLKIGPDQFVFGSVWWAVTPGLPHPAHLTLTLGDIPTSQAVDLPVADAGIPPLSSSPTPDNASQSTAYALLTSSADPAALGTLTATVTVPSTARLPSPLTYSVTLANHTDIPVPLTSCPEFGEQLSVVPDKIAITVGARGLLNCSQLPPAITENSSVTMLMQLDTTGQVTGPGRLTWQLLDNGNQATAVDTTLNVQ